MSGPKWTAELEQPRRQSASDSPGHAVGRKVDAAELLRTAIRSAIGNVPGVPNEAEVEPSKIDIVNDTVPEKTP